MRRVWRTGELRVGCRLSRRARRARTQGEADAAAGRRLPFARVMWFGLGDAKGYSDERFKKDITWILDVVSKAGITDWAVQLPGRASGLIGARRAIEIVLDADILVDQPVSLLEDPAGQKDIAELLRSQR